MLVDDDDDDWCDDDDAVALALTLQWCIETQSVAAGKSSPVVYTISWLDCAK